MKILLIEDDKRLAKLVKQVLEDEHYSVDVENDGEYGLEIALRSAHDLVIVDWMLPGRDGPSICRKIRSSKMTLPILMLTARGQIEDRVTGLESGADDYLIKPFDFDELIARIRALSRRYSPGSIDPDELRLGSIVMDVKAHSLRRANESIELTKKEWDLLEYFLRHPNQTLSRTAILDYVWSAEASVQQEMVDVYVSYLRQKITVTGMKDPIQTIRGFGYMLDEQNA
ncbi:MAG: DNA-binding response regulator [Chloroflexi bacterium HGW-Chloroflexi-4]|nr:MAG: DNA-binding response regulator [Chloroflexi bacterium HGW-Chloroflexi-4]